MPDSIPDLSIPTDKLCFIISKARQFDVKDVVTDPGDSSNATDDAMLAVLDPGNKNTSRSPQVMRVRAAPRR